MKDNAKQKVSRTMFSTFIASRWFFLDTHFLFIPAVLVLVSAFVLQLLALTVFETSETAFYNKT